MTNDPRSQLAIKVRAEATTAARWRLRLAYFVLRLGRSSPS